MLLHSWLPLLTSELLLLCQGVLLQDQLGGHAIAAATALLLSLMLQQGAQEDKKLLCCHVGEDIRHLHCRSDCIFGVCCRRNPQARSVLRQGRWVL